MQTPRSSSPVQTPRSSSPVQTPRSSSSESRDRSKSVERTRLPSPPTEAPRGLLRQVKNKTYLIGHSVLYLFQATVSLESSVSPKKNHADDAVKVAAKAELVAPEEAKPKSPAQPPSSPASSSAESSPSRLLHSKIHLFSNIIVCIAFILQPCGGSESTCSGQENNKSQAAVEKEKDDNQHNILQQ